MCLGCVMSDHRAAGGLVAHSREPLLALERLPWDAHAGAMYAGTALGSVVSTHGVI